MIAADVYALPPHTGRGGWTWYTGSAGWMYRLIVESLLGVTLHHDRLRIAPCLPAGLDGLLDALSVSRNDVRHRRPAGAARTSITEQAMPTVDGG